MRKRKRGKAKRTFRRKKHLRKHKRRKIVRAHKRPKAKTLSIAGVHFTHPDRVYWPKQGITKHKLADYYVSVWKRMSPHVANRPLALLRCPTGINTGCFFQKHITLGLDDERFIRVRVGGKTYLAIRNLGGMLALVQAGVLEVHTWGCKISNVNACDRVIFDLDPGGGVPWQQVVKAAREVRDRLAKFRLKSFAKLSGGKGIHVVMPLGGADWKEARAFAQAIARQMARDNPKRYIAKASKSARRGHIFIDYLRNGRGNTTVAPYATRARQGAPISVPVTWEELGKTRGANQYTVRSIARRLSNVRHDPWAELGRCRQGLPPERKWPGSKARKA
jgi:bifunctional non-homologous end joining protein LigD